jgi:hypothetical protein
MLLRSQEALRSSRRYTHPAHRPNPQESKPRAAAMYSFSRGTLEEMRRRMLRLQAKRPAVGHRFETPGEWLPTGQAAL